MVEHTLENEADAKAKQRLLGRLFIQLNKSPEEVITLANNWFQEHPNSSWSNLEELISEGEVIIKNNKFTHLITVTEIKNLVEQMRSSYGLIIKDRRYHFKLYPKCFIGSEAIDWLVNNRHCTREEAITIGNILVKKGIFHHVVYEHGLKDGYFFYRFYQDE